ncbi:MFS transporter [Nonomuraea longicatena]|uniref:Major facilitator superfamily (MFS) profile domain-containing protein n=1 Tax=Nonomuraea longicatena TaxID=83682 RepID=A0ABN1PSX6_9ACTN
MGGAAIPVLSVIAVTRLMPENRRGTAIGVLSAASGAGAGAGPAIGGGIGQFLGWPALFWIMLVLALVLFLAVARILPDEAPQAPGGLDLLGGVLLGLGAGLALFGITQAQVSGWAAPASWASLVVAAAAFAAFAWRTVRIPQPFVSPALFANPVYRSAVVVAFLAMAVNLGGLVFVPLMMVDVNGAGPGVGALAMIPAGIAVAAVSPLIGRLTDRIGTRPLVLTGLAVMGLFALFLSTFTAGVSVLPAGIGILGFSVGFILVITALVAAAAGELPADQTGAGMGVLQGAQFLGAGGGPALLGALVAARQQSGGGAVNPLFPDLDGAAYSDAFLAMAVVAAVTWIVAFRTRGTGTRSSADRLPQASEESSA